MDLRQGTFLNWPLGPYWEENADLLELMHITWSTWRFCLRTVHARHEWTAADINFDTWLNAGRPRVVVLSDYERWLAAQEDDDAAAQTGD